MSGGSLPDERRETLEERLRELVRQGDWTGEDPVIDEVLERLAGAEATIERQREALETIAALTRKPNGVITTAWYVSTVLEIAGYARAALSVGEEQ